jgi:hypothetical protein
MYCSSSVGSISRRESFLAIILWRLSFLDFVAGPDADEGVPGGEVDGDCRRSFRGRPRGLFVGTVSYGNESFRLLAGLFGRSFPIEIMLFGEEAMKLGGLWLKKRRTDE